MVEERVRGGGRRVASRQGKGGKRHKLQQSEGERKNMSVGGPERKEYKHDGK